MDLKVRSIDFNYDGEGSIIAVNVRFDSVADGDSLNGSVKITEEEYSANSADLVALAGLVKTKVKAKMEKL